MWRRTTLLKPIVTKICNFSYENPNDSGQNIARKLKNQIFTQKLLSLTIALVALMQTLRSTRKSLQF
jgi:hypothetical protein